MDTIINATFKLRGTEKEIEKVKARIASLSACEEVVSLYLGEEEQYPVEKEESKLKERKMMEEGKYITVSEV